MRIAHPTESPGRAPFKRDPNGRACRLLPHTRRKLRRIGGRLLAVYWLACLGVIGVGVDRIQPQIRQQLLEKVQTWHGERPYPSCAAAFAAGVCNIPWWSRAYTPEQDGDADGLACEPSRTTLRSLLS